MYTFTLALQTRCGLVYPETTLYQGLFFFSLRWAWFVCLRAYFICHNFVLDQLPDAEPVELSRHHQETLFLVVELVQLDQSTWQLPPQTDTCIFCASYAKANGLLVKLYVKETKASWVYA